MAAQMIGRNRRGPKRESGEIFSPILFYENKNQILHGSKIGRGKSDGTSKRLLGLIPLSRLR